jgi:hypothetical protein
MTASAPAPAAPFALYQPVMDRFGGKAIRGHVARITAETNGVGEPYWFVVIATDTGEVGSDAADLIADDATAAVIDTIMFTPKDTPMQTAAPASTILDRIRSIITSYVILPDEAYADILALWTLHTHTFIMEQGEDEDGKTVSTLSRSKSPRTTPYIYITSQGPGSGKTRLMEVLVQIVRQGRKFDGGTGPAFFRLIEARRPTLFIDEIDTVYSGAKDEDMRQMLNGGYKFSGCIPRVDNSSADGIRDYGTFCAKVIAGIDNGHVPTTVLDRAIKITMVKTQGKVAPFFEEDVEDEAADLIDEINAWVAGNIDTLNARENRPAPLDGITDRQNDMVRPLLTIAERCGWGDRARRAFITAFAEQATPLTPQVHALNTVRNHMLNNDLDKITSAQIVELTGENGKQIGTWFAAFGLKPGTYSFDGKYSKGYKLNDAMREAWHRFLPALPGQTA